MTGSIPRSLPDLWRQVRDAAWQHPRWLLAVKTAIATGLAYVLAQPLGGSLGNYSYYAPMGAAVAMSTTVIDSLRMSVQAIGAIALGAVIALGIESFGVPQAVGIGLTIAVATLLAGSRFLGDSGSWVLVAALFVLVLGGQHPMDYVAAYVGLTAAGAALSIGINLLVPQLPLAPVATAQTRLRESLADELDALAEGLTGDRVVDEEDLHGLRSRVQPHVDELRQLVDVAHRARRANWRAGRWSETADRRYSQTRALERLAGSVDEVTALVADQRSSVHADDERGAELREAMARALRAVGGMLRSADGDGREEDAEPAPTKVAQEAVDDLHGVVGRLTTDSQQLLTASAVWVNLQRAVEAWS
ncbi:aromatic acid exporter family protein [Nocardioides sp. SYSU DS0663]|uniref:FUSC family protein n=1 Tax=Nocardioides sp. SYSU DS0663 TaxID=3416445 RepID=UPI003F4B8790